MKKFFWISLVLATCIIYTWCGKAPEITEQNATERDEMTNTELNDCKKWCDFLSNETTSKEDCYKLCETSKKLESDDIKACDDIEKTSGNFVTKDVCIQDKAIQAKKAEYCELIGNEINKDSCYLSLATDMKDKTLCDKVSNEVIKTACMENETEE